ncbi:hypothetical protein CELL_02560 [Cellulomonas sp. T2.31MG-18]|uniref:PH domain-containing protein n=1 Tax=Cellulomonas sp. T2.31MG-18 TaxID=3157619 RepID=UPI0035EFFC52
MTDASTPFRPRLARAVTLAVGALAVVLTVLLLIALPGLAALDKAGFALLAVLIGGFCWRQADVQAVPDDEGLTVRNLVLQRRLVWADIVSVRFGHGRPWVQLDLADGTTLAVMGIQRSDGAFANREARRLATLVAQHTATSRDD